MTQKFIPLLGLVIGLIFLGTEVFFTVDEREKVLVLQFGEASTYHDKPGLKMKMPFIQALTRYDSRLLGYTLPALEVTAGDQKRVVADLFIRYHIKDTLLFYKKVINDKGAENRLSTIVDASMRRVIGRVPLADMLSEKRSTIMASILNDVINSAKDFGVEVKDVRIIKFDLPPENSAAIFQRMETERRQEAKQFRSEGEQRAQELRADADRQKTLIVALAQRDAEIKKAEGDKEAGSIYASAYGQDPSFFAFWRSLGAYRKALKDKTSFIMGRDDEFFKYFQSP